MPKKSPQEDIRDKAFKKLTRWFWILFASAIGFVVSVFLIVAFEIFEPLPTFEELENPETNYATEIISSDNQTIGKFYKENRTPVKFNELPKALVQALIATEDERFYSHSGIDFKGTLRAIVTLGKGGGASTITQQLAKLL